MRKSPLALLIGLVLLVLGCFVDEAKSTEWLAVDKSVEKKYPGAHGIELNSVVRQMENGQDWLFLDCRSEAEYDLSHIPGAYWVQTVEDIEEILKENPYRIGILYCSVGMRSGKLAEAYSDKWNDIRLFNLKRGIFGWANAGRALENESGPADKVHPYDDTWKRFLKRDLRAEY